MLGQRNEQRCRKIFQWNKSVYSPDGTFIIYRFKVGPDGELYATGIKGSTRVFCKLVNKQWEIIAEVAESAIVDFTMFNDTIYFTTDNTLKKAKNKFTESIISIHLGYLEVFKNRIVVSGTPIAFEGNDYTIMSFDGESFKPIDAGIQSGLLMKVNNKLFISGDPLKIFDGTIF